MHLANITRSLEHGKSLVGATKEYEMSEMDRAALLVLIL